jgi:hypothetical protein
MRTSRAARALAATAFVLLAAVPAHAVSNRIFLSTNGNNASDCANPLTPCLTFAGALAQVNPGGEVIAEATGGYGPLNITQAVTISGPPGVVIYSGLGVTVNAPGATVVLRGLTIDGTGATATGITATAVGSLFVENCVIANFLGSNNTGDGIVFSSTGHLFVKDTIVRNIAYVGVFLAGGATSTASIQHCQFDQGEFGVSVSGAGNVATVRDSAATGMTGQGFGAQNGGELNIESCVAANNDVGIIAFSTSTVRVSNTTVTNNVSGIATAGAVLSRGNNTVEGNGTNGSFSGTYSAK